jgi:hypothetical protein
MAWGDRSSGRLPAARPSVGDAPEPARSRLVSAAGRDGDLRTQKHRCTGRHRRPQRRHMLFRRPARFTGLPPGPAGRAVRQARPEQAPPGRAATRSRSPHPPRPRSPPPGQRTLPWQMHRETPAGVQQLPGHPVRQTGFRSQFPQQRGPGMRHHTLPVRADLDPAPATATLHLRSVFRPGLIAPSAVRFSPTGKALLYISGPCRPIA